MITIEKINQSHGRRQWRQCHFWSRHATAWSRLMPGTSQVCHIIQKAVKKYQTPCTDCSCYHPPQGTWTLKMTPAERKLIFSPQVGFMFVGRMLSHRIPAKQRYLKHNFVGWITICFGSTIWIPQNVVSQRVPSCHCWLAPCRPGKRDSPGPRGKGEAGVWVIPHGFDPIYWDLVEI